MLFYTYKKFTGSFVFLSVVYIALTVLLPPDKATLRKYHLTSAQALELSLLIVIPYLVIWFIALGGFLRLKAYAEAIKKDKDGAAFNTISQGVMLLSLWLPLSAILSMALAGYYRVHPSSKAGMVIFSNYINVLVLLPALWLIYKGSKELVRTIRKAGTELPLRYMLCYIAFSALYVALVLNDPAREAPHNGVEVASYYLPDWLTITTVIIPRLIAWFLGIYAVYNILLYRQKVKGVIYKNALKSLALGLCGAVISVIVLRCFQSLSTVIAHLSLGAILVIIFALLALIAVGYVFIAKGAQSLLRLER